MSGIEEAYAKYAKNLLENKLNQALDRLDEQGAIIANLRQMILNLQEKVERHSLAISTLQMQYNDICEEEDEKDDEETRSDLEFIKQQLYENHKLLEKIDKYNRLQGFMNWLAFLGIVTLGTIYMIFKMCKRIDENEKILYSLADSMMKVAMILDNEKKEEKK